ncbi:MAG: GAF domain-containing sensor histidine kinase [Anaerolineae bacterium]|jgi:signal transduction histidine kinase|nr:GAF domain-containing sensor histidine kinase [Anaerolineae bacterium]MBT7188945.1 GAF domain-containing sensor histidine kinase [Anaerolineae bacterium]MBT7991455.1 GAF domain-containing sensor histidine kinase [Anaerolineae bacterium]
MLGTGPLESSPDLKETVARLRRLVDLGTTLNSTLNLNDLLKLIIQTAADVLECEATSILLYDEQRSSLFFAAATGEDADKLSEIPVPIDNSLAGTIFTTKEPLILNRIEGDPRHNAQASEHVGFQAKSLLGVPLRIRDKTIGVLEALNKKVGSFSDADKNLLVVVASHAAVAIHNAQLVKALKKAYEDVTKADQLKSNFLALASHELRTPLGIIIGYATFLREESEGQNSEHAEQVLNAAMQMRTLLEDMNNLTMLEADTSSVAVNKILLQDILEGIADEVKELAQIKRQTIAFDFPEEPLKMMLDEKKFRAAVVNLFHNAIRFSPEKGEVIVGAQREKESVIIWVKDHGIGIPKKELEDIFKKFYQVESPNVRRYGGMGIGLTIAQGLVKEQAGRLWAESEGEGKGATFKIMLPYKAA